MVICTSGFDYDMGNLKWATKNVQHKQDGMQDEMTYKLIYTF